MLKILNTHFYTIHLIIAKVALLTVFGAVFRPVSKESALGSKIKAVKKRARLKKIKINRIFFFITYIKILSQY